MIKTNTGKHEAQESHDAKDCRINEAPHNHPDTDCGHYVPSGPGYQMDQDAAMPGPGNPGPPNPSHNDDQDPEHGPGVK